MPPHTTVRQLRDHAGASVQLRGWVQGTRRHGKIGFIVLRDGTGFVQCVLVQKQLPEETWECFLALTQESSVALSGEVRAEPRAPGGYEIGVDSLQLLGASAEYPIQPKEHGIDFLLDHR
ncbi:MAG TPA: OB-fold nucleic acid binding domain-containing protein, partial [Gemmatimonadaceae bacterium]|nr:OB-fold nucleic acid binding domain-containing protein [Gemmatimonadaceae bacterium]